MTPSEEFRKNADECRQLASQTSDPKERAQWLKLSEHWERAAKAAHTRPDAFDAK
jgi:hypothetical protein